MQEPAGVNRLRQWREAQGLTLEEEADLLGLSVSSLSRVERGQRGLAPLDRVRIARLLGTRVGVLFPVPSRGPVARSPVNGKRTRQKTPLSTTGNGQASP
jgi:transcriptional regulator with XRE-family HTH domain